MQEQDLALLWAVVGAASRPLYVKCSIWLGFQLLGWLWELSSAGFSVREKVDTGLMKTGNRICWHTYTLKILWDLPVSFKLQLSAAPALFLSYLLPFLPASFKKSWHESSVYNITVPFAKWQLSLTSRSLSGNALSDTCSPKHLLM